MDSAPRSAKGRRTRARLLEAGKEVFERDGFLQARITDIAARAEVSHGSFYHYFDSKESLFREIAEEVEVRLVSMDDIGHDSEHRGSPVDRIRAANRSYLLAYRREAKIMRVIEEVSRYDDDVRAVRTKRDDYLGVRLESAIARLQAEGSADQRIDKRYAALALGGMVARFAENMFIGGGSYDLEVAVEQLTLLWANSLGLDGDVVRAKRPSAGS
ncbi:TetR/AcrR family transcriptional regulator [Nocardia bovistercoris]|uniref:TetR/AcrR family transcriptional regulator n=1 Tax=Nocardia bovistercoris TaxID=2785916 RepID=A0A931N140_9NOCA|nr:TetR/AcrR family transcriptional regulator [Nocardia bovistercoris]MBH0775297.1 TetR/AcrR family transcriptional regulator [Nocardia bovistercoris]